MLLKVLFIGRAGNISLPGAAAAVEAGHQETPPVKAYWTSSQNKIACEAMLKNAKGISRTIVRPSHTVRTMLPTMFN